MSQRYRPLRIPDELWNAAGEAARLEGVSLSSWVRGAILRALGGRTGQGATDSLPRMPSRRHEAPTKDAFNQSSLSDEAKAALVVKYLLK